MTPTYKVAHCKVCSAQWQVHGEPPYDNAQGCPFCDAPADAIRLETEKPDYSQGKDRKRPRRQ